MTKPTRVKRVIIWIHTSKNTSNFLLVELVTFDTGKAQTSIYVLICHLQKMLGKFLST